MSPVPFRRSINDRGFTYVMLMMAVVLMGLAMTVAARQWKTMVQRHLEADLLAKGIEIQNALALYSTAMKAGRAVPGEIYPATLAELTRQPKPFLRKVYPDPMGHGEWELVRAPTGGIMGVRSKSKARPIKERNFPLEVRHFEGRASYADWVFQHPSPSGTGGLMSPGPQTSGASGPASAENPSGHAPMNGTAMPVPPVGPPSQPRTP